MVRQFDQIEHTTLADIIQRNTDLTNLQDNVFIFKSLAGGQVYLDADGSGEQDGRAERGLGVVTLQLLDEDGEVVGTTITGRDGRFRLDGFGGTGDYRVQLILRNGGKLATAGVLDFHIATGGQAVRGLNFGLAKLGKLTPSGPMPINASSDFAADADAIFGNGGV